MIILLKLYVILMIITSIIGILKPYEDDLGGRIVSGIMFPILVSIALVLVGAGVGAFLFVIGVI